MLIAQMQYLWAQQLLLALPKPVDSNNMTSIVCWEMAEGGWFENDATYNPLNTTQQMPGSHGVIDTGNGVYVQAYTSEDQGLIATVTTLENGRYENILNCLHDSSSPATTINVIGESPWGTTGAALAGALPAAQDAVATYFAVPKEDKLTLFKDAEGKLWWFIANGSDSYYREVPGSAPTANVTIVDDPNSVWLNLWRHVPAS